MEMALEEIQKIHLSCDEAGRVSLTVIHEKGGAGKILRPGNKLVFEKTMAAPSHTQNLGMGETMPRPASISITIGMTTPEESLMAILKAGYPRMVDDQVN